MDQEISEELLVERNRHKKLLSNVNSLSGLLKLAVLMYNKLDRKKYVANYNEWHWVNYNDETGKDKRTSVCLAGAVLAASGDFKLDKRLEPFQFNCEVENKIKALNWLSKGNVEEALYRLFSHYTKTKFVERTIKKNKKLFDRWHNKFISKKLNCNYIGWQQYEKLEQHYLAMARSLERVGL